MNRETHSTKTLDGLPIITEEVRKAFVEELERNRLIGDTPLMLLERWLNEFKSENPEIVNHTYNLIKSFEEDKQGTAASCILSLYGLMKSQARTDNIFEYWRQAEK